jgi:F-type H+-transporting ATPase subunit b
MLEGLIELGWEPATLLAQVVNFGLLFLLLYFFAFKRILKMLDERSNRIRESIQQTEQIKEQAARAEEESRRHIEAGIKEGQELLGRATRAGEEMRQQAQSKAQEEAQTMIGRARAEIQRERDDAVTALRREFADLTIIAAEKVIDRSLDKKAHRDVIDKVLDEARTLKKG